MIVNSRMIAVQWVRCCSTGFKCWWAIGNHRKVPGRMKTSLPEWTDQSEILLKNSIELKNSILLWNPHHSPSFPMFRRTQNHFGPLNYNMIKGFSWAVTMVTGHAQHCGHRQGDCNCRLFAKSDHTKRALWYKGGCKFCVTWFIYASHGMGGHGTNFLTAVIYDSQSNTKLYWQKNNYVHHPATHPPPPTTASTPSSRIYRPVTFVVPLLMV